MIGGYIFYVMVNPIVFVITCRSWETIGRFPGKRNANRSRAKEKRGIDRKPGRKKDLKAGMKIELYVYIIVTPNVGSKFQSHPTISGFLYTCNDVQ